jgi:uncharacterized protein YneF (UPF0154 family)
MIGYKLFKEEKDGHIHIVRITKVHKPYKITKDSKDPSWMTIFDYDDNETKKVRVEDYKDYHKLIPDAIATFSIATIKDKEGKIFKDVIVTATKYLAVQIDSHSLPYAVCRQNITDIFANLISNSDNHGLVGLAVNQDTCPSNFDYRLMFAANSVEYSDFVNFYRNDTLDDILSMIPIKKYDDVLSELYTKHINYINKPELLFKKEDSGWCKDLHTLLDQNNFAVDINQMLGITEVGFDMESYMDKVTKDNDIEYYVASDDLREWLSKCVFNINIKEASIIEYDHDINLSDYNSTKYTLIRDINNKLYLVIYISDGEYYTADLIEEDIKKNERLNKFKLKYMYNKYGENN